MARMAKFTNTFYYTDTNGYTVPAASATVTVYDVDTTSSKTIYSSESGAAGTNPITLDSNGLCEFYVDSDDRRFDLYVAPAASEFTAYTLADMAATYDGKTLFSSEYATLQAAITAMAAGDRLVIDEDYDKSNSRAISTTISINNKDECVIEGHARGIYIEAEDSLNDNIFSIQDSDRFTLRNIQIKGNSSGQGAGPYVGITFESGGGCQSVVLEDIYVTDVQGDGVQFENTTDLNCTRVECSSNQGYGFYHGADSGTRATRPKFTDCIAASNGADLVLAHNDGWKIVPVPDGIKLDGCKAISSAAHGFSIATDATAVDAKSVKLSNCTATGNGASVAGRSGLHIYAANNNATIKDISIIGGNYSSNVLHGIMFNATLAASTIRNFSITGVTMAENQGAGLALDGVIAYGSVAGCVAVDNGGTAPEAGFYAIGTGAGDCQHITFMGNTATNDGGVLQEYGFYFAADTNYLLAGGNVSTANNSQDYYDTSTGGTNVIFPSGSDSGMPGAEHVTAHGGSADTNGFWLETTAEFVTGAADGTASASAACSRVTANTRVVSLVPMDPSAGAALTSGLGWYWRSGDMSAGSHVVIRMRDVGSENYRGTFDILLWEPITT